MIGLIGGVLSTNHNLNTPSLFAIWSRYGLSGL